LVGGATAPGGFVPTIPPGVVVVVVALDVVLDEMPLPEIAADAAMLPGAVAVASAPLAATRSPRPSNARRPPIRSSGKPLARRDDYPP